MGGDLCRAALGRDRRCERGGGERMLLVIEQDLRLEGGAVTAAGCAAVADVLCSGVAAE